MAPKRILAAALILLFTASISYTQSIIRQSINSFGGTSVIEGIHISETAGQAFQTQTTSNSNLVFHPGFQQQMFLFKEELALDREEITIQIFPNPATSELWIRPSEELEKVLVTITDMNGRIIAEQAYENFNETYFDVSEWSDGLYAIQLMDRSRQWTRSSRILVIK